MPIRGLDDKRQITVLLGVSQSGDLLPPQVIYAGTTDRCHAKAEFPGDWHITQTESHWSNGVTMDSFADNVLIPHIKKVKKRKGIPKKQKALLILDVYQSHRDPELISKLAKSGILLAHVPARCTSELQPLDLTVNGKFKVYMKDCFIEWYSDQVARDPDSVVDLALSKVKPLHAKWLISVIAKLQNHSALIKSGFAKAGLT